MLKDEVIMVVASKDSLHVKKKRQAENRVLLKKVARQCFKNLHFVPLRLDVPDSIHFCSSQGTNGFIDQAGVIARTVFRGRDLTLRLYLGTRWGAGDGLPNHRVNNGATVVGYTISHTDGDRGWLMSDPILLRDVLLMNQRVMSAINPVGRVIQSLPFPPPTKEEEEGRSFMADFIQHIDNTEAARAKV